jgi:uncharacterized protein GlcG (DUF336 family)
MSKLTLAQANTIITVALATARKNGYRAMGIVVLDEAGHVKAAQREDDATFFRIDVATGKAWGAAAIGVSSRALSERAKENPNFFLSLAATAHGKLLPQPGAVVIKNGAGEIIGSAGASGGTGDEDELICRAGIEAAGLQHG